MAQGLDENAAACRRNCWIAAVFFGIAVMGVAQALFDWHWLLSFITGLIAAGLLGWLLPTYFCIATEAEEDAAAAAAAEAEAAEEIPAEIAANEVIVDHEAAEHLPPDLERVEGEADSRHAPKDLAAKMREASGAKETSAWAGAGSDLKRKPGQESNVGTASYSYEPQQAAEAPAPEAATEAAPEPVPEPAVEEAPAAPPPEPKIEAPRMPAGSGARAGTAWAGSGEGLARTGSDAAPVTPSKLSEAVADGGATATPSALAEAVEAPAGETAERKPMLYDTPPDKADNLKEIKGIGPGLEKTLNEMGIYRFEQIAAWGEEEIAWVDARLKFKGRIVRDRWVEQARVLTSGGETEFSRRVDKGDVY